MDESLKDGSTENIKFHHSCEREELMDSKVLELDSEGFFSSLPSLNSFFVIYVFLFFLAAHFLHNPPPLVSALCFAPCKDMDRSSGSRLAFSAL